MTKVRTEAELEAASSEVDAAAAAVERTLKRASRQRAAGAEATADALVDRVAAFKATLEQIIQDALTAVREVQSPVKRFVTDHPVASVLIVIGAAAALMRRRR